MGLIGKDVSFLQVFISGGCWELPVRDQPLQKLKFAGIDLIFPDDGCK
jgi:hypothetical protein